MSSTRNFGQIAAFIEGDTPPANTKVVFYATGANVNWPQGHYTYGDGAWRPITGQVSIPLTNPATNLAVEFRAGRRAYVGTVNEDISITFDSTNAIPGMFRQLILIGNSNKVATFSSDFKFVQGGQPYNGQTGVVNMVNLQYQPGIGVIAENVIL